MQVVASCIGNADVKPGDSFLLLAPVFRPLHLSGKFSLLCGKLSLHFSELAQWFVAGSVGKGDEALHSAIAADDGVGRMLRCGDLKLRLDGNEPVLSPSGDGDILRFSFYRSAFDESDIADFR